MTVRARLTLTLTAVGTLLIIPALFAIDRLDALRGVAIELRGRHAAASLALGRLQVAFAELDGYTRSFVAAPGPLLRLRLGEALERSRTDLGLLERSGYAGYARSTRTQLDSLEADIARITRLVDAGRIEDATAYLDLVKPRFAAAQRSLGAIADAIDRRSGYAARRAERISASATTATLAALVTGLGAALILGFWTTRAFTAPIHRLRHAMARVAAGEFEPARDLPLGRPDEIGDLARSFRSMSEQLRELDRLEAEFMSVATHELRTPLNVIAGYAELLQDGHCGPITPQQAEAVAVIQEQTQIVSRLVNQLLDLSRLEAGGLPITLEAVDVPALLDSVARTFDPLARRKRIRFDVSLDPSAPRTITADPVRVAHEVLGNLLSNAFKFTPDGGSIRVHASGSADRLLITVADSGIGISPDQLPHIFDKYYQIGPDARARGAGLGLAIAREIVEAHRGRISVESRPGAGTTFHLSFPTRSPAPRTSSAA